MYSNFFDIDTTEGRRLNSTLASYTEAGLSEPLMRYRLAVDFPMLDNEALSKAEEALLHIHGRYGRTGDSDIEWIRVCGQDERFEPINSTVRTQFLREENPTLLLKIRFVNLNFGQGGCDDTYVVGFRSNPSATPIVLTHMQVKMDQTDISCSHVADLDIKDICHQDDSFVQSYELVIWKKDDQKYTPKTLRVYIINSADILPKVTKCILNADGDMTPVSCFDLRQNTVMSADVWLEINKSIDFKNDLDHIECEFKIDFEDPFTEDFQTTVKIPFHGGRLFNEYEGFRIGCLPQSDPESFIRTIQNVDSPICFAEEGTFKLTLSVWGRKIHSCDICFEENPIADDLFAELLEELSKPEATKQPEPAVQPAFNPFEYVKLERYTMYHVPNAKEEDEIELVNTTDDSNLLTAFPQSETRCISIVARYNIIKEGGTDRFKDKVKFRLYDNTGRLLSERTAFYCEFESILMIYAGAGKFCNYRWRKGRYMAEFVYEDTCIAGASFEIGDRRIDGEYEVRHIMKAISRKNSQENTDDAYTQLMEMIGLGAIKEKIEHTRSLVDFFNKRKAAGLPAKMPALHTCFIGNPGTGKTTVAKLIGQIYKDLGLLSKGHVVEEERKTLLGRFYDSESKSVADAVERAQGGILLIDEAYNLYVKDDPKDPGKRVLENLLTELSDESKRDWMLILAGYPSEMSEMLDSNTGLGSRLGDSFYFEDYTEDELMEIAELYCRRNRFTLTDESRIQLHAVIKRELSMKDEKFGNGRFVNNLMDQIVTDNMAHRLSSVSSPTEEQLMTILPEDIPSLRKTTQSREMAGLKQLIGLGEVKRSIESHMNYVKLLNMRIQSGLGGEMPPLHMIFTGNPGTGKTTVAAFMGEIYASMGILSHGDVISVERSDLVGSHIGETELKVRSILNRAKGNVLFIDEAYQLYNGDSEKDFGKIAMDTLLTTLSKDNIDMIVILAGYTKEMNQLVSMNTGIKSRFPYTFHFEDYSIDELIAIAVDTVRKQNYEFTPEALERLTLLTKAEIAKKDAEFGNARFVKRLISTKILTAMADRIDALGHNPTEAELSTITADDIPLGVEEAERMKTGGFDEAQIGQALAELDAMIGMDKVKSAIHNFVEIARYRRSCGERICGHGLLKWSFAGNTGTGKSTVAEILAKILKAMGLLSSSEVIEVKGEEIFNVSEYQCNQVLTAAMQKARYGMLLIDGDSPEFRNGGYYLTTEQLKIKLSSLTAQQGGAGAVIIAENASSNQTIATSLAKNGIYDFDHTLIFDDYDADQLFDILCSCLKRHEITFSPEAEAHIRKFISDLRSHRDHTFANARTMKHLSRTIADAVMLRMSREASEGATPEDDNTTARVVIPEDVESYVWNGTSGRIGYHS